MHSCEIWPCPNKTEKLYESDGDYRWLCEDHVKFAQEQGRTWAPTNLKEKPEKPEKGKKGKKGKGKKKKK